MSVCLEKYATSFILILRYASIAVIMKELGIDYLSFYTSFIHSLNRSTNYSHDFFIHFDNSPEAWFCRFFLFPKSMIRIKFDETKHSFHSSSERFLTQL